MNATPRQRVLVTGSRGQLGGALQATAPTGAELTALDLAELDIGDRQRVLEYVAQLRPELIINAAAYTAVDKAETERATAFRVNADGAGHLAEAATRHGARLIHVSTDYVFDGTQARPHQPDDAPNPLNVYGESKLAGEQLAAERSGGNALIVRTAWVYSASGQNFVKTILRLLQEKPEVRVINDQFGAPTHAEGLARALWKFAGHPQARGLYHWTDAGTASWFEFAQAIRECGQALHPDRPWARLTPIPAKEYPSPTRRPAYSVLDWRSSEPFAGVPEHWTVPLKSVVARLCGVPRTAATLRATPSA